MCFIKTTTESLTGSILYGDCYAQADQDINITVNTKEHGKLTFKEPDSQHIPCLSNWARIPILGIVAGVVRCVIAIFHIIGHLFASLGNRGHLAHALKGCCELGRGLIEALPIIGRLFAWRLAPPCFFGIRREDNYFFSFFLVKIYNPNKPDAIDGMLALDGVHPFLTKV